MSYLDNFINQNYDIGVSYSAVLSPFFKNFAEMARPLLQEKKVKIFLTDADVLRLRQDAIGSGNKKQAAKDGLEVVRGLLEAGVVDVMPIGGASTVPWLIEQFCRTAGRNLLWLTQSHFEAEKLLKHLEMGSAERRLANRVSRLYEDGNFRSWYLRPAEVPANEIFPQATTLRLDEPLPNNTGILYEGNTVYGTRPYVLGTVLGKGGEGRVFAVNDHEAAKIYFPDKLTKNRQRKIELMTEKHLFHPNICFPREALYSDPQKEHFVGYLMPRLDYPTLDVSVLDIASRCSFFPHWELKEIVRLCICIMEAVNYLHSRNIYVADFNPGNILVAPDATPYMIDCDSWQVEDMPCTVGTSRFTPPELQGKGLCLYTESQDMFAAATLVFMILHYGAAPYARKGGNTSIAANIAEGIFPYDPSCKDTSKAPNGPGLYQWPRLTYRLRTMFYETFQKGAAHYVSRYKAYHWLENLKFYMDLAETDPKLKPLLSIEETA